MPILYKAQISNTADTDSKPVMAEFGNGYLQITLKIGGRTVYQGKVQGNYSGPSYSGVINVNYLMDAVHTMHGDFVEILLQADSDAAWRIKNRFGYSAIIMPIDLKKE